MPHGHTQPIPTNQVEINLPEGQEVCVVFKFRGQPVAECAIHDCMAYMEDKGARFRKLVFEASPVDVDDTGEAHGLDDFPAAEAWDLRQREDTVRPDWIYGQAEKVTPE